MNNILVHLVHCFSCIVFAKGHLKEEVYLICQLLEIVLPFKDTCCEVKRIVFVKNSYTWVGI